MITLKPSTIKELKELAKKAPITWMYTSNYISIMNWEHPEVDPLNIDIQLEVQEILTKGNQNEKDPNNR